MKRLILFAYMAAGCIMPSFACIERTAEPSLHYIGCTPADDPVKSMLGIDLKEAIDYFRWDLQMEPANEKNGQFSLLVRYGEGMPNTQEFRNGGEKRSLKGNYTLEGHELKLMTGSTQILFRKIDENLLHLLAPTQKLMVGNGGWSYTLNRVEPVTVTAQSVPFHDLIWENGKNARIEFQGRTPCQLIAKQLKLPVSHDCWKIKWLMILNRDPDHPEANTFQLRQANIHGDSLQGNWEIRRTDAGNILLLKMKNAGQDMQLQFLVGDENVLFILDEQQHPLVGNSEFSYTLNRRGQ